MAKKPRRNQRQEHPVRRNPVALLGYAQVCYAEAEIGWRALCEPAPYGTDGAFRMLGGLRAVAVSGRQVVSVMRKLKRVQPFVGWLEPILAEIESDPLASFFTDLRDAMEHAGLPPLYGTLDLLHDDDPVGEVRVEVSLDLRGVWTEGGVRGSESPVVMQRAMTTNAVVLRHLHFENPPTKHLGGILDTDRVDMLSAVYLTYLRERLLQPAREKLQAHVLESTDAGEA